MTQTELMQAKASISHEATNKATKRADDLKLDFYIWQIVEYETNERNDDHGIIEWDECRIHYGRNSILIKHFDDVIYKKSGTVEILHEGQWIHRLIKFAEAANLVIEERRVSQLESFKQKILANYSPIDF